jgi:hypothetical protein
MSMRRFWLRCREGCRERGVEGSDEMCRNRGDERGDERGVDSWN